MSLTSKSRKESTESHAAQRMHNTMGVHPELAQLNDKNLDNELPTRVTDENNVDPEDVQPIDDETTRATDTSDLHSVHDREMDYKNDRLDSAPMDDEASFDRRRNPDGSRLTGSRQTGSSHDGSTAELGHS